MDAFSRLQPSRLTLRFPRRLEREYQRFYSAKNIVHARLAFSSGIALYMLFTYLDYVLAPALYDTLLILRMGIATPVFLLILAFMFTRYFGPFMQPVLVLACVLVSLSVNVINVVAFEHTGEAYYFGVIITNMYLLTFGRVQWAWAAPTAVLNVLQYLLSLLFVPEVSFELLATSNFFVLSSLLLGMVACYTVENMARREFLHVQQLAGRNAELQVSSSTDPLTGLTNRRYMLQRLKEETARCNRTQRPWCIAIADADHFKRTNDRFGHACGDEVLKALAGLMKSTTRGSDVVSRWGGEEFLLFYPETSLAGARIAAEQMRRRVAALELVHEGIRVPITITIGLAEAGPGEDPGSTLRRADNALYEGKRAGRNRTAVALPAVTRNVAPRAATQT